MVESLLLCDLTVFFISMIFRLSLYLSLMSKLNRSPLFDFYFLTLNLSIPLPSSLPARSVEVRNLLTLSVYVYFIKFLIKMIGTPFELNDEVHKRRIQTLDNNKPLH